MRYLITGGAGFIGSHLAEALLTRGHEVTVLDDFSTGSEKNLDHIELEKSLEVIHGSTIDPEAVHLAFEAGPGHELAGVFHLASAVGVKLIMDSPAASISRICAGTACLLGNCLRNKTPLLLASTSEVYGRSKALPYREDTDLVLGPPATHRWGYAVSKLWCEFLAMAHHRNDGLPVTIARLFNTVGPRQSGQYGMVIPRLVQQALASEPMTIYGDGKQTRSFCHVKDTVRALIGLMECEAARGQVFNVGNDSEVSIDNLVTMIGEYVRPFGRRYVPFADAYGPGFEDMPRRVPDLTKIRQTIGFKAQYSLWDVIQEVVSEMRGRAA